MIKDAADWIQTHMMASIGQISVTVWTEYPLMILKGILDFM